MYNELYAEKIVNFICEKKMSTTEVSDCLQKTGAVRGSLPLSKGLFRAGIIHYIYAHSDTNWPIHEQLRDVPADKILFVDNIEVNYRALFGELVSMFIIEKLKCRAIVTKGYMRDAAELIENKYPVWCGGITPEGCFNVERAETPIISMKAKRNRDYYHGAIAVCDDGGVVVIPKEEINEQMYQKLVAMDAQEETWFHCVRDLGWNTFDTVCLKKYLNKDNK